MQQSARETCSSLLTSTEFACILGCWILEIQELTQVFRTSFEFLTGHSVHQCVEMKVLMDGELSVEGDLLRHVTDVVTGHFAAGTGTGSFAEDHHAAFARSQVREQNLDQRCFA